MSKITNDQLIKNMNNFKDKEVLLMEGHSHAGQRGRTIRAEMLEGFEKPGMLVILESGEECHVFENKQIMFITHTTKNP